MCSRYDRVEPIGADRGDGLRDESLSLVSRGRGHGSLVDDRRLGSQPILDRGGPGRGCRVARGPVDEHDAHAPDRHAGRGRSRGSRLGVRGQDRIRDVGPHRGWVIADVIVGTRAGDEAVVADDLGTGGLRAGHDGACASGIDRCDHKDLGPRREGVLRLLCLGGRIPIRVALIEHGRGTDLRQLRREGDLVHVLPACVRGVGQQQGHRHARGWCGRGRSPGGRGRPGGCGRWRGCRGGRRRYHGRWRSRRRRTGRHRTRGLGGYRT